MDFRWSGVVKPDWLEPLDAYGWAAVSRNLLPLLACLCVAPLLASRNALTPWLLSPAIGLFIYRITVVMHDCTHRTLFRHRGLNGATGLVLGAVSGIDFKSFCRQHWKHHESYGCVGDPQGFQYAELRLMTSGQLLRHIAKPLLGVNLREVAGESILSPRNIARMFRTGQFAIVVPVQLAILIAVTGAGRHPMLAALPALSSATFGLFFSQLRGIAEHGAVDLDAERTVRSHRGSWLDRLFLYDVNFNYHAEHHLHPQIPSCHLPAAHRALSTPRVSRSMFETLVAVFDRKRSLHV